MDAGARELVDGLEYWTPVEEKINRLISGKTMSFDAITILYIPHKEKKNLKSEIKS